MPEAVAEFPGRVRNAARGRTREVRARTLPRPEITSRQERDRIKRETAAILAEVGPIQRPVTRGDCANGPRPCPFVGCRHHLYLDVSRRTGSVKLNFPDLEVWQLPISCSLDIADAGEITLEAAGEVMNLTRERVRQLEVRALARLEAVCRFFGLSGAIRGDE